MWKLLGKFVLTLGIIAAVGATMVLSSPEAKKDQTLPEVQTVEADILNSFGSDGKEFDRAIVSLGMKPRPYDFNGNVMYFANASVKGNASEVANIIQDTLVHTGVNSRNYMGERTIQEILPTVSPEAQSTNETQMRDAMLIGELVPTYTDSKRIEMAGVVGPDLEEFNKRASMLTESEAKDITYRDFTTGYRWIEVSQQGADLSEVLAVWTDDNFDARRMDNREGADQSPPDPTIPACIGCVRDRRVTPLDKDEPYEINKWHARQSVDQTYDFYRKTMNSRGWKEAGIQPKLDELGKYIPEIGQSGGKSLTLEKDGKVINITVLQTKDGGSEIFSLERYRGAQPTLDIVNDSVEKSKKSTFGLDF